MDFETKQGDTRVALQATLSPAEAFSDNVKEVRFRMADQQYTTKINRPVNVWSCPNATVIFTESEVADYGLFYGEFVIEYNDGKIETVPNNGYLNIKINKRLGE